MMLPKTAGAKAVADFRPIASLRLLYKTHAYMVLNRLSPVLETAQPEEQHGFRSHRRIEEHLITASVVVGKFLCRSMPVWIVSLDLSKAFDRVGWPALWAALREHNASEHLVWLVQCVYHEQHGEVVGVSENSRGFPIRAGVRQGCVLSPKLFSCLLQWAMTQWRLDVESLGIDFGDGLVPLLDLRFADDLFLFALNQNNLLHIFNALVNALSNVGLCLNASKTVVLTNET